MTDDLHLFQHCRMTVLFNILLNESNWLSITAQEHSLEF